MSLAPVAAAPRTIELWGGVECTINRVGETRFTQLDRNGHLSRPLEDVDAFAALGLKTVRQPALWEQVAPHGSVRPDWDWVDACLGQLRTHRIEPIVGLVHHGAGPAGTGLDDPAFGEGLATYAAAVATRYPWVRDWTPVNEPLTTARFSGLYGHWAPHGRDPPTFWRVLRNECRATVLAMRGIRRARSDARLVQTEDLGHTWSTPRLGYQARFNNQLRWLSWDLLCGRVDRAHALYRWLRDTCRASPGEIDWFADNPCPPDLVGINHYVTSGRYLDDDVGRYPAALHGGNGRDRYVDIEAVRVLDPAPPGIEPLLQETWNRYRLPIAITEAHLGGHREEQLRWLDEIWRGACRARAAGVDLRAVTAWALLGSHDWDCLLTERRNRYESGVFDVRGARPRPTALASLVTELARGGPGSHPVLASPGWWRRPSRMLHPDTRRDDPPAGTGAMPILITGADGTLGQAFARICRTRGLAYRVLDGAELDVADADAVRCALDRFQPWAVVNAAGFTRVDAAERQHARCFRENAEGPAVLALACERDGIAMLAFSSDLVFDGLRDAPYIEDHPVAPLSVFGRSQAEGERLVLERHPAALVVRTSACFGPWSRADFVSRLVRALRAGRDFAVASDVTVSPTYLPDLVHASLDLLIDREAGLWHLCNGEPVTWLELGRRAAFVASVDATRLCGRHAADLGWLARRPVYSALGSGRGQLLPALDDALARCMQQGTAHWNVPGMMACA